MRNKQMKRITSLVCIFALVFTLTACAKIRQAEFYRVAQHNGGWSILYDDGTEVEEIAALGSAQQPLAIEKGRIYFTQAGKLVSVDMDGEDRQETAIADMPQDAIITFADEAYFYCLADRAGSDCWRINKADVTDHVRMTIPRQFRFLNYPQVEVEIRTSVPASNDLIYVRSAEAVLDSNGCLLQLDLEVLACDSFESYGMKTWKTSRVQVINTLDGLRSDFINENLALSVSDSTISEMLSLSDYIAALDALDEAAVATGRAQGQAEFFRVVYAVDAFEDYADDNSPPVLSTAGTEVSADSDEHRLILAQVGGCDAVLSDDNGEYGNLAVIQLD